MYTNSNSLVDPSKREEREDGKTEVSTQRARVISDVIVRRRWKKREGRCSGAEGSKEWGPETKKIGGIEKGKLVKREKEGGSRTKSRGKRTKRELVIARRRSKDVRERQGQAHSEGEGPRSHHA